MAKKKTRRAARTSQSTTRSTTTKPAAARARVLEVAALEGGTGPTAGDRHLEFFEREAALSRGMAMAIDNDDADPEAFGVAGRSIIAEGDSWFDYEVLGPDLIDLLNSRHKCVIMHNYAHAGDTLENMVYGTELGPGFQRRPSPLDAIIDAVRDRKPKAFLFSGGGNDVAGEEFAAFLNHRDASDVPVREAYADEVFGVRMPALYERLIERVLDASPRTRIYTHGYGNAIPSGIPAQFALWTFGPWLRPGLVQKGWTDLTQGKAIVADLIGRFNDMLAALARKHERFHYVDLRPVIDDRDWVNELHLGRAGYVKCAAKMYGVIERTAEGWPR